MIGGKTIARGRTINLVAVRVARRWRELRLDELNEAYLRGKKGVVHELRRLTGRMGPPWLEVRKPIMKEVLDFRQVRLVWWKMVWNWIKRCIRNERICR